MDADSDEVIIKRKPRSKDTYKYDVYIAESLVDQGFSRNVHYFWQVCPTNISRMKIVISRLLFTKGVYPNGIIEANWSQ